MSTILVKMLKACLLFECDPLLRGVIEDEETHYTLNSSEQKQIIACAGKTDWRKSEFVGLRVATED